MTLCQLKLQQDKNCLFRNLLFGKFMRSRKLRSKVRKTIAFTSHRLASCSVLYYCSWLLGWPAAYKRPSNRCQRSVSGRLGQVGCHRLISIDGRRMSPQLQHHQRHCFSTESSRNTASSTSCSIRIQRRQDIQTLTVVYLS